MKTRAWGHFLPALVFGVALLLPSLAAAGHVHRWNCPPHYVAYWGPPQPYWGTPGGYWGTPGGAYWDGNAYGGWSHDQPHQDRWHGGHNKGPHWGRYGGTHQEGYPRNQPERHDSDQHPRWRR
jgi:hypothetical protein